jgi:hypothetical protein
MKLHPIIRDRTCIGFILSAGPKGFRAYDHEARPIGLYDNEHIAAKAVYEAGTVAS